MDNRENSRAELPRDTLIIHGNCQAEAIANILKKTHVVRSLFRIAFNRNFNPPGRTNVPISEEELANCRIFWNQQGPMAAFPYLDQLPRDCVTLRFPLLDFNLVWPFGCVNPYNKPDPPQSPSGPFPYGDRIIVHCVEQGMSAEEILEYYLTGWEHYQPDLKKLVEFEESRQAERDSHCEVKMGEWVMEYFRRERLHWTANHPTIVALRELLQRLLRLSAGLEPGLEQADIGTTLRVSFPAPRGPLGIAVIPVHPGVAESLQLQWYQRDALHPYFKKNYTYEQYFRELIDYCINQRTAGLVATN
jgi:hypothetical protein